MAGFLYFLPNVRTARIEDIRAMGLGYAFDAGFAQRGLVGGGGPEGLSGCIVTADPSADPDSFAYLPDRQTWQRIPPAARDASIEGQTPGPDPWVGYVTASPPGPADLAREVPLPRGHSILLGGSPGGRVWRVPVAIMLLETADGVLPAPGMSMPRKMHRETGEWTVGDFADLRPGFQALYKTACAWWDARLAMEVRKPKPEPEVESGPEAKPLVQAIVEFAGSSDAALRALAANYRLGRAECSALGLFGSDRDVVAILNALIDWPTWQDYAEKKTLHSSVTGGELRTSTDSPGSLDATPATDPALPTS
jgi:hypothetical protein